MSDQSELFRVTEAKRPSSMSREESPSLAGDSYAKQQGLSDALGLSGSTQRPRRVRLVELGLVRDSGNRRASEARRLCTVWVAT